MSADAWPVRWIRILVIAVIGVLNVIFVCAFAPIAWRTLCVWWQS